MCSGAEAWRWAIRARRVSRSTDDVTWNLVGTIDVPTAAATQDVGLTQTSHASGTTGEADFDSFTTTP
ncbi:hypothetical protein SAMN05216489_07582 [Streptomyces sp. 3213]|uniref:hypothetical protein n=1 Tax=Streptomyces sp. 3213.3 TaxID=1855348 RepID=UPI00089B125E|nr:hypothetical protein [Streptomyces sp. 3213.3]SEE64801.1 hypothetical protein SAMN05216489_07582 [Streptomyces sp. 3213] [Streptomyces sp. 3213.3]